MKGKWRGPLAAFLGRPPAVGGGAAIFGALAREGAARVLGGWLGTESELMTGTVTHSV